MDIAFDVASPLSANKNGAYCVMIQFTFLLLAPLILSNKGKVSGEDKEEK